MKIQSNLITLRTPQKVASVKGLTVQSNLT
jgi:hypothetical protein